MLLTLRRIKLLDTDNTVEFIEVMLPITVKLPQVIFPVTPSPPLTTNAPVPVDVDCVPALA